MDPIVSDVAPYSLLPILRHHSLAHSQIFLLPQFHHCSHHLLVVNISINTLDFQNDLAQEARAVIAEITQQFTHTVAYAPDVSLGQGFVGFMRITFFCDSRAISIFFSVELILKRVLLFRLYRTFHLCCWSNADR